jgi:hypothetical protein
VHHAREFNEAVAGMGRKLRTEGDGLEFLCECDAEDCAERLLLTLSAYDELRTASEPLLVPGHVLARAAEAKARARDLVDSASALKAQSAQQKTRALRIRRKLEES